MSLDDTNEYISSRQPDVDSNANLDELLKHHQSKQESIVEELMGITKGLREHSELAGKIIRKDIEVIIILCLCFIGCWLNLLIYFMLGFRKVIKRYGFKF